MSFRQEILSRSCHPNSFVHCALSEILQVDLAKDHLKMSLQEVLYRSFQIDPLQRSPKRDRAQGPVNAGVHDLPCTLCSGLANRSCRERRPSRFSQETLSTDACYTSWGSLACVSLVFLLRHVLHSRKDLARSILFQHLERSSSVAWCVARSRP